jgi:hypothetical protein
MPEYVKAKLENTSDLSSIIMAWERVRNECNELIEALRTVSPLVIDYFLAQNPRLWNIGRFLIAATMLECEVDWLASKPDPGWYRFIMTLPDRQIY